MNFTNKQKSLFIFLFILTIANRYLHPVTIIIRNKSKRIITLKIAIPRVIDHSKEDILNFDILPNKSEEIKRPDLKLDEVGYNKRNIIYKNDSYDPEERYEVIIPEDETEEYLVKKRIQLPNITHPTLSLNKSWNDW